MKSRLNVVDVVGESVSLKKAGATYKGLCPFHGEKTPSFVVTPARDSWHCFGCGLGGDVFSFVMQRDGVPFVEALKHLAGKAGVELDERTRRDDVRKARQRDVMEAAIAFYHAVLTKSKAGQPALDYLRGRGVTDATIETYQLGWAPAGWDQMGRALNERRQIRAEELAEVGLASPRQNGRGFYDRFRQRVIFPIRDQNGSATGLGGRILPPSVRESDSPSEDRGRSPGGHRSEDGHRSDGPKYLNSPATPLFDKSRTLYLIDRAKGSIRRGGQAVIVEGYTDALMAHQAGYDNVVASLGTALTPGQVALLTRYAKRIALAYDVDAAGEKAGTFGVQALEGLIGQLAGSDSGVELDEVRVVRLPDGKDPDEVIRETPDRWREEVRTAEPIVDYLIDQHARQFDLRSPGGKSRFVDAIMPTIRAVPNPVMRDAYLGRVRQVSGVEERVLLEVLHRPVPAFVTRPGDGRINAESVTSSPDALPIGEILRAITNGERDLLRLMLLVPDEQLRVGERLGPDQLPSTVARELFRAIVRQRDANDAGIHPPFDSAALIASLDDETAALARALYALGGPSPRDLPQRDVDYEVERLLLDLEEDGLEQRRDFTQEALGEAERSGDRDAIGSLLIDLRQLNEARRSLDRRRDDTRYLNRPVASRA
ncbi:MAG TPA: CHC2 zinc finger domain-containing protein [Candidatus Limnocylindrales bacterium]|nr:CHC2 zinc finger domain-containing protein [Candidatus Limnocylindrales bacterium]